MMSCITMQFVGGHKYFRPFSSNHSSKILSCDLYYKEFRRSSWPVQRSLRRSLKGLGATAVAGPEVARRGKGRGVRCGAASSEAPQPSSSSERSLAGRLADFQAAFWKFLRPHTIRGTILGSFAVTARALLEAPSSAIDWGLLPRALLGVLALLCGNGYIVGINQIYDVDIDAVNKPFLPIASGEMTPALAWLLCAGLAGLGITICARNFGKAITSLYSLGLFLGTIYSVPPLRLKRFAIAAFLIIATVRGFLLNFGVYSATRAALGLDFVWSPAIIFITTFVTVFATVIAITKDLPDVEGDRRFQIETFATRLGVRRIAFLGSGLLLANYVGAITYALRQPGVFRMSTMVGAHALLAAVLVLRTAELDRDKYSQAAIAKFYRNIWSLFYLEYALLPLF
eukprot:jgi/Botrbrau1/21780/Bobra.0190s0007.1